MRHTVCVELSGPIPAELIGEVTGKLPYAAVEARHVRVDPANSSVVTFELDHEHRLLTAVVSEKIRQVVGPIVDGYTPVRREVFADRGNLRVPAGGDPMEWLVRDGHAFKLGQGQYGFGPLIGRLMSYFDGMFGELAEPFEPDEYTFPSIISSKAMARCDYFTSFPHSCCFVHHLREDVDTISSFSDRARQSGVVAPEPAELSPAEYMLAPAVCFHWYNRLADRTLPADGVQPATAIGKSFRYEAGNLQTLERLWDFTMRELIFVGPGQTVQGQRERSMDQWRSRLDRLGVSYTIESATDPFFVAQYQKRTRFQAAFHLKYEIRLTLPYCDGSLAVGSFNYHQDFFGRSLGISLEGVGPAHTACTAIGLERWAFAFLCQFGSDRRQWPDEVAKFVGADCDTGRPTSLRPPVETMVGV